MQLAYDSIGVVKKTENSSYMVHKYAHVFITNIIFKKVIHRTVMYTAWRRCSAWSRYLRQKYSSWVYDWPVMVLANAAKLKITLHANLYGKTYTQQSSPFYNMGNKFLNYKNKASQNYSCLLKNSTSLFWHISLTAIHGDAKLITEYGVSFLADFNKHYTGCLNSSSLKLSQLYITSYSVYV